MLSIFAFLLDIRFYICYIHLNFKCNRFPKEDISLITITDVAKAAGVSTATVSRVLHNKAVKPHTKEAVMNAVKELNYKPNALAQQ